jgi:hypothetical protein
MDRSTLDAAQYFCHPRRANKNLAEAGTFARFMKFEGEFWRLTLTAEYRPPTASEDMRQLYQLQINAGIQQMNPARKQRP